MRTGMVVLSKNEKASGGDRDETRPADRAAPAAAKGRQGYEAEEDGGRRINRRVAPVTRPRRQIGPSPCELAEAADLGDDGRVVRRR